LKYYYDHATANDSFVGGLSGKGYCKPDYFTNDSFLEVFINESNILYEKVDLSEGRIWMIDDTGDYITRNTVLDGIFDGYSGGHVLHEPTIKNGVPIIKSVGVNDDISKAYDFIKDTRAILMDHPAFIFFHLHCWSCNTTLWTNLSRSLDRLDGVEVVHPDVLVHLLKTYHERKSGMPRTLFPILVNLVVLLVTLTIVIVMRKKRIY
jgi:hypothetical protein